MIINEILSSSPSHIIDLFEADFTSISSIPIDSEGNTKLRFFNDINEVGTELVWNGDAYTRYPFELTGIEWSGAGLPTPKLTISNIGGLLTALNFKYQDLLGLRVTRYRTMLKYLDAVNFPGGINPDADPTASFPKEVFYIDRKVLENSSLVEYDLVSALDISSIKLPRRLIIQNMCQWKYKDANCGYIPSEHSDRMSTSAGVPTNDPELDNCGKRLSDCKYRFGATSVLNYGAFPGAGLFN